MKLIDLITEGSNKKINCSHCDWSWKESEGGKDKYVCHKCGHDNKPGSFDEFAQTRMKGADKIATINTILGSKVEQNTMTMITPNW